MTTCALVADDDALSRELLSEVVQRQGWKVVEAADGAAALKALRAQRPDVILSDVHMPGLTGVELARHAAECGGPPVILVTGQGSMATAVAALRAGAEDYLLKPVTPQKLEEALDRVRTRRGLCGNASPSGELIGDSPRLRAVVERLRLAARSRATILLAGEYSGFSGAKLQGADFTGHDLTLVRMGGADLRGANFSDCDLTMVDLSEANLEGADMSRALLMGTRLDQANLAQVRWHETKLHCDFGDVDYDQLVFRGMEMTRCQFSGGDLSGKDLRGCDFSMSNFMDANLEGANFAGSRLDKTLFVGAKLKGAQLGGVFAAGANFFQADVSGANLSGANLRQALFAEATTQETDFSGADLTETVWTKADATAAQFPQAKLTFAQLDYATLDRADLRGANLSFATLHGIESEQAQWRGSTTAGSYPTDKKRLRGETYVPPSAPAEIPHTPGASS